MIEPFKKMLEQMSVTASGPLGAEDALVRKAARVVAQADIDLAKWVDAHVNYLAAPIAAEILQAPSAMIEMITQSGRVAGDADDFAVLVAAMGRSIGLDAQFVLVRFEGCPFASHVFTRLKKPGEAWPADPIAGKPWADRAIESAVFDVRRRS